MTIIKQIHKGYKKKVGELQTELSAIRVDLKNAVNTQKIEKLRKELKQKQD